MGLVTIVCSILVFFISVYGTKEVSFEENLKASQIPGNSNKKKAQESKKKAKKVQKSEAESGTKSDETKPKKSKKKKKSAEALVPEQEIPIAILETICAQVEPQ